MPGHHPSQVAGLRCSQHHPARPAPVTLATEQGPDRGHRRGQPRPLRFRQRFQHPCHGFDLVPVQVGERRSAARGEPHDQPAPVDRRALPHGEALGGEPVQDPAQVPGVEPQPGPEVRDLHRLALRQLVQHPRLGQRVLGPDETGLQHPDHPRIEAVEPPHLRDRLHAHRP